MKRLEFRLSMPGRSSWNGGWSGEGRNYVIYREISNERAIRLLEGKDSASWSHSWSDGWSALVTARVMAPGERAKKSEGFSGYGWMVDNILLYGATEKPAEVAS